MPHRADRERLGRESCPRQRSDAVQDCAVSLVERLPLLLAADTEVDFDWLVLDAFDDCASERTDCREPPRKRPLCDIRSTRGAVEFVYNPARFMVKRSLE